MKCYEMTKCSDKERETCYVWNSLREKPEDFENLKCWVLKGMYQEGNKGQAEKCVKCKYYVMMNRETGLVADYKADVAVVGVTGTLNLEKTRALGQVWETLNKAGKINVVLDITSVNTLYSCGIGMLVTIHKECAAAHGTLMIAATREQLHQVFEATKLTKLLNFAPDKAAAIEHFTAMARKQLEASQAAAAQKAAEEQARKVAEAAEAAKAAEAEKQKAPPKKFVRCWEYWDNHNPKNASTCDECFQKLHPTNHPCWVVDGLVDGVSFQFINEDCVDCKYFAEYGVR